MAPSEKPPHPPFYLLPNPKPPKIQAGPGISTFPDIYCYWVTGIVPVLHGFGCMAPMR